MPESGGAMLVFALMPSPVGPLKLVAGEGGLRAVLWGERDIGRVPLGPMREDGGFPVLSEARLQLEAYFDRARHGFDLPLDPVGTPFQRRVWAALLRIPFGEVRSYGALASELGDMKAVRAVGAANGRNPISIIVPCHRVLGADGSLVGFAGGLEIKTKLLKHEGHRLEGGAIRRPPAAMREQLDLFA